MKLEGSYTVHASREIVYHQLLNPAVLARAMPGCEKLVPNPDGSFSAEMRVGISVVKGRYRARVQVLDAVPPEHYRMKMDGQGTGGFLKAEGTLTLSEESANTVIHYSGEAEVGGPIAAVAQRLMVGAARQIAHQFFEAFAKQLQPTPQPSSPAVPGSTEPGNS